MFWFTRYRYALGVYNRKRKRLDIYETESNGSLFNVTMVSVTNRQGTTTYDNNDLTEVSAKARRDMLIESFGSRKKKAMERSKAANIVDVSAIAAAEQVAATLRESSNQVSSSSSTTGTNTRAISTSERKVTEALNAARRTMLPPFNELASIPDDAYPFDGIITNEEVDEIQYTTNNIIRAIATKDNTALEQLAYTHARGSEYVRDRLFRLSADDDKTKSKTKKRSSRSTTTNDDNNDDNDDDTFTDKSVLRKRVRALLYLKCLLALHRSPNELRPRTLTSSNTGDDTANPDENNNASTIVIGNAAQEGIPQLRWIPTSIQNRMLSLFTEQRANTRVHSSSLSSSSSSLSDIVYVRTPDLIDKLITWIACLSLIIDGYTTDLRLLAIDMRLTPVRLLHFYKELGCTATPVRSNLPAKLIDTTTTTIEQQPEEEINNNEEGSGDTNTTANKPTVSGRSTVVSYTVVLHVPLNFPKPKIGRART